MTDDTTTPTNTNNQKFMGFFWESFLFVVVVIIFLVCLHEYFGLNEYEDIILPIIGIILTIGHAIIFIKYNNIYKNIKKFNIYWIILILLAINNIIFTFFITTLLLSTELLCGHFGAGSDPIGEKIIIVLTIIEALVLFTNDTFETIYIGSYSFSKKLYIYFLITILVLAILSLIIKSNVYTASIFC